MLSRLCPDLFSLAPGLAPPLTVSSPPQNALLSLAETVPRPLQRVRPGAAGWPTPTMWDSLKQQVGGRLIPVYSPLANCQADVDSATCQELLKNIHNPYFIGDQPGLTQTLGWVGAWTTAPSAYAVEAASASDIAAAVNFARENHLRLVVKGGGHSYQGTSNAPDSLLVWTRHMREVTLHPSFVPQGCDRKIAPQPAVTLGAGCIWMDAYQAVTTRAGQYVQGGGCTTVGVAGLVQSGGFGSFSKHYGTAAAGLLEAEVVTADGKIRIVNACRDADLFFALKGGGGGSFGVVSKLTLRMRELPQWFGAAIITIEAASDDAYRRLLRQFLSFYRDQLFNDHWGEQIHVQGDNTLEIRMVSHGLDGDESKRMWQPFLDWLSHAPQDYTLDGPTIVASLPARHWWDVEFQNKLHAGVFVVDPRPGAGPTDAWWGGDGAQCGQVLYGYESLWLPALLLEGKSQDRLVDALFAASRHWDVELHFNKGLAGAPAEAIAGARDTATNPVVLDSFALAIIAGGTHSAYPRVRGHEPDVNLARNRAIAINQAMNELRKVAPYRGAYVSESNYFEKGWQYSFWGMNYPRLQEIKRKYDPDGLFFVHHGVGSDEWSDDGFTRVAKR